VEPDTPRPFEVPFGKPGAWFITIPKILVLTGVLLAQSWNVWLFCGTFNVLLVIAYIIWRKYQDQYNHVSNFTIDSSSTSTTYGTNKLS
jgi:membrane protein implicated in regulation of membrane protease activity